MKLAAALALGASLFGGLRKVLEGFFVGKLRGLKPLCYIDDKGILPDKVLIQDYAKKLTVVSTGKLIRWARKAKPICNSLVGKLKSDCAKVFTKLHDQYRQTVLEHETLLPPDYKFFGTGNNVENLQLLLQNNPFYASALTINPSGNFVVNTIGVKESYYSRLIAALDKSYPRVNAVFNSKLELTSFQYFDDSGSPVETSKTKSEAAGDVAYLLTYYSECVHALIHVFHYMNAVAIGEAAKKYPKISLWAQPYISNVPIKFMEVVELLFKDGGLLCGGEYRADPTIVKHIVSDMLRQWGSFKTAAQFTDDFIFAGLPKGIARSAGLLPEFLKHVDLIHPFATELTEVFAKDDPEQFLDANAAVELVLANFGAGSQISSLATWIELMSVTGIVHGSTLSLSRLILTEEYLKRTSVGDKYTTTDAQLASKIAATIMGMIEDRHVFSSSLYTETGSLTLSSIKNTMKGKVHSLAPQAKAVLLKYDLLSTDIKWNFFNTMKKDLKFNTQGWILSDHFPDGIDGKQLTITTYI